MRNVQLFLIFILLTGCAPQNIVKQSPNHSVINSYFQDKEVAKINAYDISEAETIISNFREYLNKKSISKLELGQPTADMDSTEKANYTYYATLSAYDAITIVKSEPESGYDYLKMRDENDLDIIKYSQYATTIKCVGGFIDVQNGASDLKTKGSNPWTRIIVDSQTGGIILFERNENKFKKIELKLKKNGELKITPPNMNANQLTDEGSVEFYTALELLEHVQNTMGEK